MRNILHPKHASPEWGVRPSKAEKSTIPLRANRTIQSGKLPVIFLADARNEMHVRCTMIVNRANHDESRPARQTAVFEIWNLPPTSRRGRPIVSADHAPGLVTSTPIAGRVCPHRDAWVHTARGRHGFRNEQGFSKEALAASTPRNTRHVNPVLAAFLSFQDSRGTLALGGGRGTYGAPGSRRGFGAPRENRFGFRSIRFWTCATR